MKPNLGITHSHSPSQPSLAYPTIEIATSTEIVEFLRFSYKYGHLVEGCVASTIEVVMVTTEPFTSHLARRMRLARSVWPGMPLFRRVVTLDYVAVFPPGRGVLRGVIRPFLNLLGLVSACILADTSALHYRKGCASGIIFCRCTTG